MTFPSDPLDELLAKHARDFDTYKDWPNCIVPDCKWKQAKWANTNKCAPHSAEQLGLQELERRFCEYHGCKSALLLHVDDTVYIDREEY